MSVEEVMTSKKAANTLRKAGQKLMDGFLAAYGGAIQLRSKEPGICWKASGQVAFAAVSEFSGPNTMDDGAPLLLRIRTNLNPPPAIFYHIKSPAVRQRLGLPQDPLISTAPALELTALPEEIGEFGQWLTVWLDSLFCQQQTCPTPPVPLISWGCGAELEDEREMLTEIGRDWGLHLYLWTPRALEAFETWLKR